MAAYTIIHFLHSVFPPIDHVIKNNPDSHCKHTVDKEWNTVTFEYDYLIAHTNECASCTGELFDSEEAQNREVHAQAVFQIEGNQPKGAVWVNADRKDEVPLYLIPEKSKLSDTSGLTMEQIKERIRRPELKKRKREVNTSPRLPVSTQVLPSQPPSPSGSLPSTPSVTGDRQATPQPWLGDPKLPSPYSIERGKTYFETMLKGDKLWKREHKSPQEALGHVMNFLYAAAAKKGQQFDEGTYVVEVSKQFLILLFQELTKKSTEESPYVYQRLSSHQHKWELKGRRQFNHYGFDLKDVSIYPAGKRHILIFPLKSEEDKHYCFIKPENYGTADPRDLIRHACEYGISLLKRMDVLSIDPHNEVHRKERPKYLPQELQDLAQELKDKLFGNGIEGTEESFVNILSPKELEENYKHQGLGYLIDLFKNYMHGRSETDPLVAKLSEMFTKYNLDHLSERVAQEVILKLDELIGPEMAEKASNGETLPIN